MNIFMTGLAPFLVEEKGVHVLQLFQETKQISNKSNEIYISKGKNNRIKIMQVYIVMS